MNSFFEKAKAAAVTLNTQFSEASVATMEAAKNAGEALQKSAQSAPPAGKLLETLGESLGIDVPGARTTPFVVREVTEEEIKAMDLHYVTPSLVSMAFPLDPKLKASGACKASRGNDINTIANALRQRHSGHFMIWNLSEEVYDYGRFDNQVLEYFFPGHPAPPLGLLFKICTSIDSWLQAGARDRGGGGGGDEARGSGNVAIVHCLSGKGRTATVLACYLAWSGECSSVMEGLQVVCGSRRTEMEELTIPSQRRYLQYFSNMLDGVKPRSEPLLLRRCIMNTIPRMGNPDGKLESRRHHTGGGLGCRPYLQLFKNGKLLFTTAWAARDAAGPAARPAEAEEESSGGIPWAYPSDGSIIFPVDTLLQGDILVRLRHHAQTGARVTMFRAAFHTGYVPSGVLRLSKSQLDGACDDPRFDADFFVDLIFGAPEAEDGAANGATDAAAAAAVDGAAAAAADEKAAEARAKSTYDEMLHRDAKFWDEIAVRKTRRQEEARRRAASAGSASAEPGAKAAAGKRPLQTAFTIAGQEDASFEEDEGSAGGAAAAAGGGAAAASDTQDLLAQLEAAEAEAVAGDAGTAAGAGDADGPAGGGVAAHSSLAELEELEKTLGLVDLDGDEDGAGAEGAAAAGDVDVDVDFSALDEDLDGLESYLVSLGTADGGADGGAEGGGSP